VVVEGHSTLRLAMLSLKIVSLASVTNSNFSIAPAAGTTKRKVLLVMLQAYLDDSGSDGLGPVFLLSGYVATAQAWKQFSEDWRKALDGPPKLEYFKMREANSLRKQFWGWNETQRNDLLMTLAQIIKRHVSLGITSALWYEDLEKACADFADITSEWKGLHQYQILFHGTMAYVANHYIGAKSKDQIEFIFDEQGFWGLQAIIASNTVRPLLQPKEREIRAAPAIHGNDKDYLPLQAADMIAWQTRRFIVENAAIDPATARLEDFKVNSPALNLLETIPTLYNTYGVARLRSILSDNGLIRNDPAYTFLRSKG
jgi:hypothetical protein